MHGEQLGDGALRIHLLQQRPRRKLASRYTAWVRHDVSIAKLWGRRLSFGGVLAARQLSRFAAEELRADAMPVHLAERRAVPSLAPLRGTKARR